VGEHSNNKLNFNLLGKDYLNEKEAAHYAGVSYDHFRKNAIRLGVFPARILGKKVYRKADLQRVIEEAFKCHH